MNPRIFFSIVIFLSSLAAKAQNSHTLHVFNGDITAYIYDLVAQKAQYQNKTVNNLLASLELPVTHYVPNILEGTKMAINVKLVGILFYTGRQESAFIKQGKQVPIGINIYFSPVIPITRVDSVTRKYPFTSNAGLSELFGQCLVTDITPIK